MLHLHLREISPWRLPDTGDPSEASAGTDAFDPDTDGDGIGDRLDRSPLSSNNACALDASIFIDVVFAGEDITCAARFSISVQPPAEVQGTGKLELISPEIGLLEFNVGELGQLIIRTETPCPNCQ